MSRVIGLIFTLVSLSLWAGNEGGHGGDPYALEFVGLAQEIVAHLGHVKFAQLRAQTNVDTIAFKSWVKKIHVHSDEGDKVILDGQEVDAINFPLDSVPRIELNRTRWRIATLDQKLKLVLHEYLSFM